MNPKPGVDGEQQALFERDAQWSLFNVSRRGKTSTPQSAPPSELERLTDEDLAARNEALPGQGSFTFHPPTTEP